MFGISFNLTIFNYSWLLGLRKLSVMYQPASGQATLGAVVCFILIVLLMLFISSRLYRRFLSSHLKDMTISFGCPLLVAGTIGIIAAFTSLSGYLVYYYVL